MNLRLVRVILGMVSSLILAACTENGGSIFYVLEHEKKQPDSTIGKYLTVADVVNIGDKYYAAAGAIFVGSTASGALSWLPKTKLAPPISDALCNALAEFGGDLYGGFINSQGNLGLYKAVVDDFTAAGAGPVTSGTYLTGGANGYQVIRLISVPGTSRLLIVTAKPQNSTSIPFLYYLTAYDGTNYPTLLAGLDVMINDATFDGTNYWAVAGSTLYSGTGAALLAPVSSITLTPGFKSNDTFQGVYYSSSTSSIYVSTRKTGLYISSDGGLTWIRSRPDDQGGTNVSYFGIASLQPLSDRIIIGSDGYGLYYYTPGATDLQRSDDSDMITLDLYDASIQRFLVNTSQNLVLACTNGKGLWRGTIDPSNPSGVSGWEIQ